MKLYALKRPDGTLDHQHVAHEEKWVWDLVGTFAAILGANVSTNEFRAELERNGYKVVEVKIVEVIDEPDEPSDQMQCQRCGCDIDEYDVHDNKSMCCECYDKWCDECLAAEAEGKELPKPYDERKQA